MHLYPQKIQLPGTIKQLHLCSHKSKKLLVICLPHLCILRTVTLLLHLSALLELQILNKRLWTRSSPPLTLAEKQNITRWNAPLKSCATCFTLVKICRCRSQDDNWILSMFRRVWGLRVFINNHCRWYCTFRQSLILHSSELSPHQLCFCF